MNILAPLFEYEVIVLDELGAAKPSEWVQDTIGLIRGKPNTDTGGELPTSFLCRDVLRYIQCGKRRLSGFR